MTNLSANVLTAIFKFVSYVVVCIWAPSSEFVSSSIPSWQIVTAHAQPFRGARDLAFCLKVPLDSLLVWASSEGSGETARMRRLAWTFAARIGDKYQIGLTRSIYKFRLLEILKFFSNTFSLAQYVGENFLNENANLILKCVCVEQGRDYDTTWIFFLFLFFLSFYYIFYYFFNAIFL